jgi:hypothetical protein
MQYYGLGGMISKTNVRVRMRGSRSGQGTAEIADFCNYLRKLHKIWRQIGLFTRDELSRLQGISLMFYPQTSFEINGNGPW